MASARAFLSRRYSDHGRTIVYAPVARLQLEFLLGYSSALALAQALEEVGFWRIDFTGSGRIALLHVNEG